MVHALMRFAPVPFADQAFDSIDESTTSPSGWLVLWHGLDARVLMRNKLMFKQSTIFDTTITPAPSSTKNAEEGVIRSSRRSDGRGR
jgi:hypothetical protein